MKLHPFNLQIHPSNSSANKIAANRLHFDYIFYLATVHRQFFELATRPSIQRKWRMDFSDTLKSNMPFRMLRLAVR